MMQPMTATLAAALALLAACGDSVPDTGADPGETEPVTLDGVYSVPVPDPALEPYASQPVVLEWRDDNGRYRLDYDFPSDLTGTSQRVAFEGFREPGGTIRLSGSLGTATCEASPSGSGFLCTERFPRMVFDLERLQRDLERRGLPPNEIARRLEVAAFFQSDPIGILSFSLD
jgi:hypothetical protein